MCDTKDRKQPRVHPYRNRLINDGTCTIKNLQFRSISIALKAFNRTLKIIITKMQGILNNPLPHCPTQVHIRSWQVFLQKLPAVHSLILIFIATSCIPATICCHHPLIYVAARIRDCSAVHKGPGREVKLEPAVSSEGGTAFFTWKSPLWAWGPDQSASSKIHIGTCQ